MYPLESKKGANRLGMKRINLTAGSGDAPSIEPRTEGSGAKFCGLDVFNFHHSSIKGEKRMGESGGWRWFAVSRSGPRPSLAISLVGRHCGAMPVTIDRVLEDGLCLSEESRILLAERLLESIAPHESILRAQVAVAVQRAKQMELGLVKGVPGEEALRRVRTAILQRSQSWLSSFIQMHWRNMRSLASDTRRNAMA